MRITKIRAALLACGGLLALNGLGHAAPSHKQRLAVPAVKPQAETASPNLIGHWPGDGNADDTAGGHNGILENGAKFAPGHSGKAFSFDGHSYVSIPFNVAFDFTPGDQFTVSAWVKPAATGTYQAVFVKDVPGGPWEWGIIIDPQNHFYTGRDAHDVAQSKTTIQPGHWYFVAVTYKNGALNLFVNGKLENQASGVSVGQSVGGIAMGHKGETALPKEDPDWYTGLIDDARLYNRALSAVEVTQLFQGKEVR